MIKRLLSPFLLVMGLFLTQQAMSADKIYTSFWNNEAAGGYDVVSYFTEGKPKEGKDNHSYKWQGADWLFSSAENLALFKKDPKKYAPQYGGHCAWAVATKGELVKGDPEQWRVVDGKLYLNYDASVQAMWVKSIPLFIEQGDAKWPGLNK